ncbi:hypothetical protein KR059_003796, partial [Drosophila kikkawai]
LLLKYPVFRCFFLLFLGPLCLGFTSRQVLAEKQRVIDIMHTSQDARSKIVNTPNLVALYNRVSPYMPPEQRLRLDRLVAAHTNPILVDGVPSQGGRMSKYAARVLSSVASETSVGFFNELGGTIYYWLLSILHKYSNSKN